MTMTTFRPVNTSLAPDLQTRNEEDTAPTTPRPNTAPSTQPVVMPRDDATTPTRANFGSLPSQRPLPASSPFPSTNSIPENEESPKQSLNRGNSQYSAKSKDSQDVEMGADSEEGEDGSDDESVINADGTKSSKKKKSQRFYCTDYPPCGLSFTRSEHLARHIRKHTGERPFQCHCSRRFSRLDNLRQHAQTVHLNEEIPQDSLAATGTRFQRQVRTDRVRPPGSRSRAATTTGQISQGRGHTRNSLSASSISSVASMYSQREDVRRRPPPLVMAGEPRGRFSQEMYPRPESPAHYQFQQNSPGFSTPTSATFSTGQNSPRWGASGIQSPMSSHSRTASLYGHRTPGRRLSVPSAGNPFQSPHGSAYGPQSALTPLSATMGSFSPSSSIMPSPTSSTAGSFFSRRESMTSTSDEAWRRRTWHPDTNTGFTSRLQVVTTPNYYSNGPPPQPQSVLPSNAPPLQPMRLPGIESFDPLPPRPTTPVRRQPSPMMLDATSRETQPVEQQTNERPSSQHWDMGINRNLNRLDLAQGTPPSDTASSWASEANRAVQAQAEQARAQPSVRFEESPYSARAQTNRTFHQHTISAPPITPRESKRHGWYHGPVTVQRGLIQRTSPADSSSSEGALPGTPGSSHVIEVNPSIVHANGWVENRNGLVNPHQDPREPASNGYASYYRQNGPEGSYTYTPANNQGHIRHQHQVPKSTDSNMLRLEALVAVATSEENAATPIY
ncbi:hypothetical protein HYFRA_00000887 [Hymenoscyphus fraxineus]|uniref:C2H2-type domain-containing protein n=1 Tax=Hymenoscyphus fraxineus TaxID=746836 RepID=A0A9N9PR59_9HELO|nr:hypothetical protein HYFRA_00000887 [Hymenoscyphus fraxineus]